MSQSVWGDQPTQYFYALSPDKVLDAVEALGFVTTGRCLTCNSMENRVYDVEIEIAPDECTSPSDARRIVKFYRPGRWTKAQILEEHQFLFDCEAQEIPVVAPVQIDGVSLFEMSDIDIWYALFPKRGGRAPDEMSFEQLEIIGRLLARIHAIGNAGQARHRLSLTPKTYGLDNLSSLLENQSIPMHLEKTYQQLVEAICEASSPLFENIHVQRIHGDSHIGNILWNGEGFQVFDFDDMLNGPPVQDIWLVVPGRDQEALIQRDILLEAYEEMADFDRSTLSLVEPLRALRYIHFSAWIAKRWQDPAFQSAFPHFGSEHYWEMQVHDLREQLEWINRV